MSQILRYQQCLQQLCDIWQIFKTHPKIMNGFSYFADLSQNSTVNYFYVFRHREERFLEKLSRIFFSLWIFQNKKKRNTE